MQPMWAKETLRPKRRSASRQYTYSRVPSACGTKLIFRTHGTPPGCPIRHGRAGGPGRRANRPAGRCDIFENEGVGSWCVVFSDIFSVIITVLVEDLLDELQAGNPRCEEFVGDGVDLRCSEELESQRHVRRCSRSIAATMTTSATATAAGCGPGVTVAMAAWAGTGILATFGSGNSWPCSSSSSGSTGSPSWATGGHRRNRWPGQTQQQNGHGQADQAVGRTGSRAGPEGPKDETDSWSGPGGPGPVSDLPTSPDGPGSDRKTHGQDLVGRTGPGRTTMSLLARPIIMPLFSSHITSVASLAQASPFRLRPPGVYEEAPQAC